MRSRLALILILLSALFAVFPTPNTAYAKGHAQGSAPAILTLRFEGALHPAWMEHFKRAEQLAERDGAQAIIVELDTPGGAIDLMNNIVEQIRASRVPVVVYVSPRGAMAASAGTMVTLAGHVAAMAPETTIGAASPVDSNGGDIGATMESKVKEVLKATARNLAANRPQKAIDLTQQMIDNAKAVSVDEALAVGLVDIKAASITDLVKQLDGRQVKMPDRTVTLHTSGAPVQDVPQTLMEELLVVLANPNIAFLLLAVGIQAILIEMSHPGGWVAGFIGVVCLLLATYGMGLLPVNWFGILFMGVAFVLFILDIKAPTHGALTAAGAGSFIIGALVLFNSPNVPSFQRVSVPLVVGTGAAIGLIFFILVGFALRAQKTPLRMGREQLIGQIGVVESAVNPTGIVLMGSETWSAVLDEGCPPAPKGAKVRVTGMEHLRVKVKKIED